MDKSHEGLSKPQFSLSQASLGFLLGVAAAPLTMMTGMALRPISNSGEISTFKVALIFGIGFMQWVYALPLLFLLFRRGRRNLAGGLLVAALALLSLNLAGFAYMARHPIQL
jgi:hypothetical protein